MKHKVRTKIFIFTIKTCMDQNILIVQDYSLYKKIRLGFGIFL